MTPPRIKKPNILISELPMPEILRKELLESSPLSKFELMRTVASVTFELFRPEAMPGFGRCGILRNNSAFGCNYVNEAGRETKMGMNFDTYPGGLGISLKFFLGGP